MSQTAIGIEVDAEGAHPAAWRHADRPVAELFTPGRIRDRFRAFDASPLAFVTVPQHQGRDSFPDVQGQFDAIELATFAAAVTSRISIVAETVATFAEPFHLADQLNSLDWAAKGRAGWLVRTDTSPDVAAGRGTRAPGDAAASAREMRDVILAVRRLWDTWEDEILASRHESDVAGDALSVTGQGLLPRPPQGQLPVWASATERAAAALIDVALVSGEAPELVATGVARTVADVDIVLDARGERAADRLARLDEATPWPESDRIRLVGDADSVAERLADLAAHVDGIRLRPAVLDVDVPVLIEAVVPALHRAGVRLAGAPTQRELFRLERPTNIFTAA
ncbi:MAG: LLM class flavin-dependent oxidoreductase [Microbacterium gubbeenense]|uniref:LLM class flavin-dependent oxidoreductase n=1 Tax=Microbacterium gubbeenense TaxID=159896 RepID=UPI003F96F754